MKTEQPAPATTFNTVKEVEANLKARMEKAVSDLQHEMATIRTGRASLGILDHIRVDNYGTPTPLNQLANLHVPEPSLITIQPWNVSQIAANSSRNSSSVLALDCSTPSATPMAAATPIAGAPRITMLLIALASSR